MRLFRKYDSPHETELASAFRAMHTVVPSSHPAGLVVAWDQLAGHLATGGDARSIRIWDAHKEKMLLVRPSPCPASCTSRSS